MDPVSMIIGALVAGLTAGATDTATQVVTDGYAKLKALLQKKFAGNAKAELTLAEHEADPETYEKPLAVQLRETEADQDAEILAVAEQTLKDAHQAGITTKFHVTVSGGKVGIIGDHGTVTMN